MAFKVRTAFPNELEEVYMMGFDAWADGASEKDYLDVCRSSTKYQSGKWYVLENVGKAVWLFDRLPLSTLS
jgi:hypothetical protein